MKTLLTTCFLLLVSGCSLLSVESSKNETTHNDNEKYIQELEHKIDVLEARIDELEKK